MPDVMTLAGPVPAADLGPVLPHEHVFINLLREYRQSGLLNDEEEMRHEVAAYAAAGGGTLVDVTTSELTTGAATDPSGLFAAPGARTAARARTDDGGRDPANVAALARLAAATGVRIVLGTGHYRDPYLDRDWFDRHTVAEIGELIVRDLTDGIPGTDGTRAGIIGEVGSDGWYVSATEERSLRAAAHAQLRTGAAITTHAARWPVGIPQLDLLTGAGVPPERVIIGHCDKVCLPEYHLELARRGAWVQFDTFHECASPREAERRVALVMALVRAGHLERILLSHDICVRDHLASRGGTGFAYLLTDFTKKLRAAGLDDEEIRQLTETNPQRALAG
ncbi:phosphotriesterase [Streptomyces gamaensis]|uniref:Phosphotriesterase n=1 Tax=Streptomyces gamaensis TaxID=1763542 RepID=A0ABW0Z8W5_9ACTN